MIKLNSDLAEGYGSWKAGNDEEIMQYIDMANLACGFHAGDPLIMTNAVKFAKKNGVTIGAHPGYQDLAGFGRRSIKYNKDELKAMIIYQTGALRAICQSEGYEVSYIKPHGALYNDMMSDVEIYKIILETISSYDKSLNLMILSTLKNKQYAHIAKKYKIDLIYEAFADRAYQDNGFLVSREEDNAVICDIDEVLSRIKTLVQNNFLYSINGKKLNLQIDSLCVHGDNKEAVNLTKKIRNYLDDF